MDAIANFSEMFCSTNGSTINAASRLFERSLKTWTKRIEKAYNNRDTITNSTKPEG
ncbi:hypothetical protein CES85_5022 [Ochrobactrum quorumnocens]|uniref:Uncharacterized protein n=1 Tax=Ochrobactrum quorumnocens TaxID=271865 RepID=A0A248UCH2_9HYPH|nr:hypothetical protein CES85_5022 [[Ochrobactrum] quorumnocens]